MNFPNIDGPMAQQVGWALIHFTWQGALLASALRVVLALMRRASAQARYAVACAFMAALLVAPLVTFCVLARAPGPKAVAFAGQPDAARAGGANLSPASGEASNLYQVFVGHAPSHVELMNRWLDQHMSWLVLAWLAGVTLLSARLGGGWWRAHRLVRGAHSLGPDWDARLRDLASRLGLNTPVRIVQSARAETPLVFGWLRPVVLLPLSCVTGLPLSQLNAVLAHELAHIRRHDYFVNLLQSALETLLFYHPAVWWISAQIRIEREHCCDDLAVALCGDAAGYARALANLETMRGLPRAFALSASGGSLLARIQRLAAGSAAPRSGGSWMAVIPLILGLLICSHALSRPSLVASAAPAAVAPLPAASAAAPRAAQEPLAPQIFVEVKFVVVSAAAIRAAELEPLLTRVRETAPVFVTNRTGVLQGPVDPTNGPSLFAHPALRGVEAVVKGGAGTLDPAWTHDAFRAFEKRAGVKVLAAPRVITLSGHQARVAIVDLRNVVTSLTAGETNTFSTSAVPVGPTVDLIPTVIDEGTRIQVTVIPELTSFLGYDAAAPFEVRNADGKPPLQVQVPMPRFSASQTVASLTVPNGGTAVITGFRDPSTAINADDKQLLIFVSASGIDSTSHRAAQRETR